MANNNRYDFAVTLIGKHVSYKKVSLGRVVDSGTGTVVGVNKLPVNPLIKDGCSLDVVADGDTTNYKISVDLDNVSVIK